MTADARALPEAVDAALNGLTGFLWKPGGRDGVDPALDALMALRAAIVDALAAEREAWLTLGMAGTVEEADAAEARGRAAEREAIERNARAVARGHDVVLAALDDAGEVWMLASSMASLRAAVQFDGLDVASDAPTLAELLADASRDALAAEAGKGADDAE